MIGLENRSSRILRLLGHAFFLPLLAGMILQGKAQAYTLNDGNSIVQINPSTQAGMSSYLVDGVNQLKQQWFYYRIGTSGPESPIETISGGSPSAVAQNNSRSLDLTYGNAAYSARVAYGLTGGSSGSGQSGMNETVTFVNKSSSSLTLSFFDYSDFDLLGHANGQSLQFSTTSIGGYAIRSFTQSEGPYELTSTFSSGLYKPILAEAALYNQTLSSLSDGNPTTLNGVLGPVVGDVTGTVEWDVTLNPGSSLLISKLINMQVPEPSSLGIIALGAVSVLLRRRFRTR